MALQMWEPQLELRRGIYSRWREGQKRVVAQSATGTGKTVLFSAVANDAHNKGARVNIIVPRRELAFQTVEKLAGHGIRAGLVMAGEEYTPHREVQVSSFDTLNARAMRTKKIILPQADIVVTDECHLSIADTRLAILESYPDAMHLGVTATPARGDGKPLKKFWRSLVLGWPIRDLMDHQYLVPSVSYYAPTVLDLSQLKVSKETNDFTEASMEEAMNTPKLVGDVVDNWFKLAYGKLTAVFAVNRKHGYFLTEEFKRRGVAVDYVDGETPRKDRDAIFKRVRERKTTVLVNVFVATYGLDIPALECAVLARPTRSLVLYMQIVGRILRALFASGYDLSTLEGRLQAICEAGKHEAMVIDHASAVHLHGYVDDEIPWTLEGDEDVREAKERAKKEREEPKEIRCPECSNVFKGSRYCPRCGHHLIPPGEEVPTYKADLVEVDRDGAKAANKNDDWQVKQRFYAEALGAQRAGGRKDGWAAWQYREKYGVWPNDPRVRYVQPAVPTELMKNWIKHRAIKRRHQHARS